MGATFERGDRVKVTIEGTVNRVLNFDGTQELRIDADGLDHFIYTDTANVEKVEPGVGVGDLVRIVSGYGSHFFPVGATARITEVNGDEFECVLEDDNFPSIKDLDQTLVREEFEPVEVS